MRAGTSVCRHPGRFFYPAAGTTNGRPSAAAVGGNPPPKTFHSSRAHYIRNRLRNGLEQTKPFWWVGRKHSSRFAHHVFFGLGGKPTGIPLHVSFGHWSYVQPHLATFCTSQHGRTPQNQLTASILAVREAAMPFCGEQCAAMHTHSSKQDSASSARDSEGVDDVFFFVPLSPPPLLPFPFAALAAAAASLAAPDVFPDVTCVHAAT